MAPLLQLDSIRKSFLAVQALKGVSFDLHPGEVHALLGENGAGKSTLIKVITGAHSPDSGTIHVEGHPVGRLSPASAHRLGIAAIYQQPALFPDLTVAENIALSLEPPRALRRVRWSERRAKARHLLERAGARLDPDMEAGRLSMPEQQLVEIAKALGAGARILIMDEPTASLTQDEVQRLFAVIRQFRSEGAGIIYISHRLEEIFEIADRVTVLRDGQSVGTRRAADTHAASLIQMMIGRELSMTEPRTAPGSGRRRVSLRNLACSASGVRDVTLDIAEGEIFGLAGLVGAGRTELARILFGITPADGGSIEMDGVRVWIDSPRKAVQAGIAYVPEDRRRHGVILEMPVAANITMAIHDRLFGRGWLNLKAEREAASGFIRDLQIKTPSPGAPVGALSGGNQQKVAVARWLATQPRLLILDEPTQGVDVGAKAEIHRIIRGLAANGMAILMISSDLPEILGMSDRIGVMRQGTLVRQFDASEAEAHEVMAAAL